MATVTPCGPASNACTACPAHADRDGLTDWLRRLASPPRRLFLTHGESEAADSLAGHIRQELGWDATVPDYGDVCELA